MLTQNTHKPMNNHFKTHCFNALDIGIKYLAQVGYILDTSMKPLQQSPTSTIQEAREFVNSVKKSDMPATAYQITQYTVVGILCIVIIIVVNF